MCLLPHAFHKCLYLVFSYSHSRRSSVSKCSEWPTAPFAWLRPLWEKIVKDFKMDRKIMGCCVLVRCFLAYPSGSPVFGGGCGVCNGLLSNGQTCKFISAFHAYLCIYASICLTIHWSIFGYWILYWTTVVFTETLINSWVK